LQGGIGGAVLAQARGAELELTAGGAGEDLPLPDGQAPNVIRRRRMLLADGLRSLVSVSAWLPSAGPIQPRYSSVVITLTRALPYRLSGKGSISPCGRRLTAPRRMNICAAVDLVSGFI